MSAKVIFAIGLPGSGKSTFAHAVAGNGEAVHLSLDMMREEYVTEQRKTDPGFQLDFSNSENAILWQRLRSKMKILILEGRTIVIEALLHTSFRRKELLEHVREIDPSCVTQALLFLPEFDEVSDRNKNRPTEQVVPDDVMESMKKLQDTYLSELSTDGFDSVWVTDGKQFRQFSAEHATELVESHKEIRMK